MDTQTPASALDPQLVAKGRAYNLGDVVAQVGYHVKLLADHSEALGAAGWDSANTATLKANLAELQTTGAIRADAVGQSRSATDNQETAIDDAKAFVRKLRNVVPLAIRNAEPGTGVTIEQFNAGTALKRSVPTIVLYLNNIAVPVSKLDGALKKYFGGRSAAADRDRLLAGLATADASQETQLAALPRGTQEVYALKGRVVQLIEDINRIARNAFDGEAATIGMFNKDLLLRGRRGGSGSGSGAPITPPA